MTVLTGEFSKQPYERFPISVDFSPWMATGATISSSTVLVVNGSGTSSTSVVDSISSSSQSLVLSMSSGADGMDYIITARVVDSDGKYWEQDVRMVVKD